MLEELNIMQDNTLLGVVAILCLTLLEVVAMMQGINGTYLSLVVAVISGIAGVKLSSTVDEWLEKIKKRGK